MDSKSTATVEPLTLEQFERLSEEDGFVVELVRGRLVRASAPGGRHGDVAGVIYSEIEDFARENGAGKVMFGVGYVLEREPPTVRVPDVAFIAKRRIPSAGSPIGWWELPPDIAVEVVSPSNRAGATLEKVAQYLEAGVRLVWVVDPDRETVTIYRPDGEMGLLGVGDTLEGEDVLPGFQLDVARIFID